MARDMLQPIAYYACSYQISPYVSRIKSGMNTKVVNVSSIMLLPIIPAITMMAIILEDGNVNLYIIDWSDTNTSQMAVCSPYEDDPH